MAAQQKLGICSQWRTWLDLGDPGHLVALGSNLIAKPKMAHPCEQNSASDSLEDPSASMPKLQGFASKGVIFLRGDKASHFAQQITNAIRFRVLSSFNEIG